MFRLVQSLLAVEPLAALGPAWPAPACRPQPTQCCTVTAAAAVAAAAEMLQCRRVMKVSKYETMCCRRRQARGSRYANLIRCAAGEGKPADPAAAPWAIDGAAGYAAAAVQTKSNKKAGSAGATMLQGDEGRQVRGPAPMPGLFVVLQAEASPRLPPRPDGRRASRPRKRWRRAERWGRARRCRDWASRAGCAALPAVGQ